MLVQVKKIVKFCGDYLKVKNFEDYCVNGLQVEGASKVSKIITGVSLSEKLIKAAVKRRTGMIIVHHGIFGSQISNPPFIKGVVRNRLKLLLENNINLCGFHLPLDAHPAIGNNISLCKLFNIQKTKPFYAGFVGEFKQAIKFKDFYNLICDKLETQPYIIPAGKSKIKRIGIVSGGASIYFQQAVELGADAYLCGDVREEVVQAVKEAKINFINAGHYNTEKLGIQNLGSLIAKKFKVEVEFIDIPCDV